MCVRPQLGRARGRLVFSLARAPATARYYETADGLSLGAGAFVSALEFASGRTADVIGKPSPLFFRTVLSELCAPRGEGARAAPGADRRRA